MQEFLHTSEQVILEKICRQKIVAHRLVERSQVIVGYSQLANQSQLSVQLGQPRSFVIRWITRWKQQAAYRKALLQDYQASIIHPNQYEKALLGLLSDRQRSGTPSTFSEHQKQQLLAIACQSPVDFGLPFTHWTHQLLSEQAKKAGIVISSRHLGRLLKTKPA